MFSRQLLATRRCFGHLVQRKIRYSQQTHFKPVVMEAGDLPAVRSNPIVFRLDSVEFKSIFNDSLYSLADIFKRNHYELRIAGGAVRDLLLHKTPTDIDFATSATPAEMAAMFTEANVRMINANGEKHGTVTARINESQFEVTTLRIDTATDGRHAEVEFTTSWQLDANRRDLTINSMFLDLEGNVYDYFYGYDDLLSRRVRFVGAAEQRIREDYLRILRYFRFYGRTSDEPDRHDGETVRAIAANVDGLAKMSGERIWGELKKILQGRFAMELMLKLTVDCGASSYLGLPVNPNAERFRRVCEANRATFGEVAPMHPITMLCGFLDTEEDAYQLHKRLKLSAYERDLAKFITLNRRRTEDVTELLFYQKECFNTIGTTGLQKSMLLELLKFNNHSETFDSLNAWPIPMYPLNGQMLRDNGCPAGQEMGMVQRLLRDQWKDSRFTLTASELLQRLPTAIETVRNCKPVSGPSPPKRHKSNSVRRQEDI